MKENRFQWRNTHKFIALIFYYGLFRFFPNSGFPILGVPSRWLRSLCCHIIFKQCGKYVNIEKGAVFGCGFDVCLGYRSGIGINAHIPSDTIIGNNVNMGPEVYILSRNHNIDRTDIIMQKQGYKPEKQTIIGDDVWIGRQVTMTPGRHIANGSVIGAGCLLCKDFPPYSVVGGNPSKLIRNRLEGNGD